MKLKYIFMFLGVMLLGLTACSKDTPNTPEDTPNTPDLSKTLAGTEWESTVRKSYAGNKTVVTTIVLKFVDDTKFTLQTTHQTIKNGAVVETEVNDPGQGTYTYQAELVTLLYNTRDNEGNTIKLPIPLTMDSSKQKLAGNFSYEATTLIFVRKK
ncbi:hypothetical protein [uncultured Porphyromonas sp.]|uniref:hypothetical protein n=1 Tax=uncultured Porphyromonas sp. TaxID=159274 RepID=UPI0025844EB2|nr:hypothetical protein [uncultured Porphyromonas sp.]